jgi:hypothetical protein
MKILTLLACFLICNSALAQSSYWQQDLRYSINAELNDTEKSITGSLSLVYKNNSPHTLDFIWFHIWPNAYKHDSTALNKQIQADPGNKKQQIKGSGSIEGLAFTVNNEPAQTQPHPNPQYIDVIKVVLPKPLLAGDSITISTPFKVFLPPYFSRSGHAGTEFMVCQWYPKPAVFDQNGWHEFPYLDRGEFYSEYADFAVTLTVPSAYVVGATGKLVTADESEQYKRIGAQNLAHPQKPVLYVPPAGAATKTLSYQAKQIPDFAWFVDKDFVIQYDTIRLRNGNVVDAYSYYHHKKKTIWVNSMDYIKDAVKQYSTWIGAYEYPVVQLVEGPQNSSSGGMEYPMITLITSPDADKERLDAVITHEVGHNWFMSMLGSNERAHTWMDEGLNTYYQFRYEAEKYKGNSLFGKNIPESVKKLPVDLFQQRIYKAIENIPMNSAMDIPADKFPSSDEYGLVSYIKTALWLYVLESTAGREKLDLAMKNYFTKWKHKHPQPADMQAAFEESMGIKLDEYFMMTRKEGKLEY